MPSDTEEGWYSDEQATLGDRLAAAREAAGLSQSELAARLGVRARTLASWENDTAEPRANRLQMLSGMLGVSLVWLLTGEGEGVDPEEIQTPGAAAALHELRSLRAEMADMGVRIGRLEKKLRTILVQAS
ncbi:helix-turn-helix domain-containing protein [Phaeovulum vinaykumarii]|uniref:Transcriptional regulator, XRE family n=1 Tax=Phaeovulum vinaykumarii TaxID=407234 RepID=A0A1N7LUE5_9RHOB|nr:helix-turn-helix transcriptional regulator [Phaeovulum vinaykumarii]SIS77478.1 transcriptional regulator, XRE family [Phaeovulum vinaykumarii]SOC07421.1 Xre family transcriptional regulator [Phaeovulum vinaykumarii]